MLRLRSAHRLGVEATAVVAQLLQHDPVAGCMVAARFESAGMDPTRLGGRFYGVSGGRDGLCFVGPNVIPVAGRPDALAAISRRIAADGCRFASVVGRAELVGPMWRQLAAAGLAARDVRANQPLLVCPDPPRVRADPRVTRVTPRQLGNYFPAAVAMFREEVGSDPVAGDGGVSYRNRVAELIGSGRAFAIFEGDEVVYKAEIGSLSSSVALIQGVWVHPTRRGQQIAAPATAALVQTIRALGRLPSLYVNAHNIPARATYARIGFQQLATFSSVLF